LSLKKYGLLFSVCIVVVGYVKQYLFSLGFVDDSFVNVAKSVVACNDLGDILLLLQNNRLNAPQLPVLVHTKL